MEGSFIDSILYQKLTNMIYDEIYQNPDISDEELRQIIYNKMKLYFAEIQ